MNNHLLFHVSAPDLNAKFYPFDIPLPVPTAAGTDPNFLISIIRLSPAIFECKAFPSPGNMPVTTLHYRILPESRKTRPKRKVRYVNRRPFRSKFDNVRCACNLCVFRDLRTSPHLTCTPAVPKPYSALTNALKTMGIFGNGILGMLIAYPRLPSHQKFFY